MKKLAVLLASVAMLIGFVAAPSQGATSTVTASGQTLALAGTNIYRAANTMVMYTPAKGATTGANQYGYEAAVVGGVVTKVENGIGNMAIPTNGYVLSGHGTAKTWMVTNVKVGVTVTLDGAVTPPPTGNSVTIGDKSLALTGTNVTRTANALVMYTPAKGATTGTNQYGYEVAVVGGKVTVVQNAVGNMAIPSNGYVLSGHGTAKTWLATYAKVGVTVTLNGSGGGGGGGGGTAPAPVTEKRTIDTELICTSLTVKTADQERTNTWQWDGTKWVDNWSAWKTVSTGTRKATAKDCVNEVSTPPSDALLPDIRIKTLNKCGAGDLAATNNTCFKIVNPNPYNEDFPALEGLKLLKFPVITLNVGDGPAEVIAERSSTSATDWKAYQTFYRPNGDRQSVYEPQVDFYYAGDGHNHWHFTDFDNYWIESLSGTVLRSAEKHGYCLEDNTTWSGMTGQPGVPTSPVYANATTCGLGLQNTLDIIEGLSKGWGDTYPSSLPDQAIDIGGLPNGRYRVGITADALEVMKESNESNNTATMEITISGDTVTTHPETATGGLN